MQTISSQVSKNPIPNPNNFLRTPIHLWIYGAPEQETPTQNPLTQRENLLEPWIRLQLKQKQSKKKGVKGKANLLHTRQQETHSPITTTLQEHQYTFGSLVLLRPGCIHSSSTSPIICEMEPLDKAVYCKLQIELTGLWSPQIRQLLQPLS